MSGRFSRTIYVGNLPADIRESEVEDLFYKVCIRNTAEIRESIILGSKMLHLEISKNFMNENLKIESSYCI